MLRALRVPALRYGFAIASVVAATLLRLALNPALGSYNLPYITYFLAVMLTAWACGLWPALLCVLLSALAAAYFFVSPTNSLLSPRMGELLGLGIFLSVGVVMSFLSEALHRARARAEANALALRESEDRFRIMADQSPVMIWIAGTDKLCHYFNEGWLKFTGRTIEQERGNGWAEGVHPEDLERCLKNYDTSFDSHRTFQMEYRLRRADGEYRWVIDTGTPRFTPAGEFVGYIGSCIDITEYRHTEAALGESEERYRAFVENSSEAIWRFELEQPVPVDLPEDEAIERFYEHGYLAECNDVMAEMYGFGSAKEIVGARMGDLLVRTDAANMEFLRAFIRSGFRLTEAESHELDREGQPVYFLNNLVGIIENGRLLRAWGTQRDITERKRAEEERAQLLAREQEARARAERAADRITRLQTITAALSEALTPAQVAAVVLNQGLTALTAHAGSVALLTDRGDELELVDAVGFPPELIDNWQRFPISKHVPLAVAVRTGQPVLIESFAAREKLYPNLVSLHSLTGNQALAAVPLIVEGRTVGGMGISFQEAHEFGEEDVAFMQAIARQCAQAIMRARLYEAERRSRAEAEAANRTKDEFLATLSHELRTPLTAMLGWTRLLRTSSLDETTAEHALATVERNARAQAQLIEDLLDVSRIITGRLRLEVHPVELVPVIEAAVEAIRPAAEAKSIRLETELDPLVGAVSGDPARLQQVVWNLVANAVKFTGKGGRIEVRLARANSHLEIVVADTGEGIRPEFLPYVFDRFRQADGSTTRVHGGLGLGLAIVRHLVELHGGTVKAESHGEGRGATFTVLLPLLSILAGGKDAERMLSASGNGAPAAPDGRLINMRVLVVDDEQDARELVTVMLERQGARVSAVGSTTEALARLTEFQPDVLISDIGMPNEDGYALMRRVRALAPAEGGRIPAIALTAYAGPNARELTLAAGFQLHLAKPIDPTELLAAVLGLVQK